MCVLPRRGGTVRRSLAWAGPEACLLQIQIAGRARVWEYQYSSRPFGRTSARHTRPSNPLHCTLQ